MTAPVITTSASPTPDATTPGRVELPKWRHVKTGGDYEEVGRAFMQTSFAVSDHCPVIVYRSLEDGGLWVRPGIEFHDGRFEPLSRLADATPGEAPGEGVEWPGKHDGMLRPRVDMIWERGQVIDNGRALTDAEIREDYPELNPARLASPSPARSDRAADREEEVRCEYCDGTGDVHDQTGEWRGYCQCPDGQALASAPTPAPEGVDLRPEDVETAAIALWRLEHSEDDEFSAIAPNDWLRWPETPREASLAYETHSREEYREQARAVFASVGRVVPGTEQDTYDSGYQHGKRVGISQEKHGRSLRALPIPDPQRLFGQYSKDPSAVDARLDPQADKVDALRVAAEAVVAKWDSNNEHGFLLALKTLRTALDAPRDGGA